MEDDVSVDAKRHFVVLEGVLMTSEGLPYLTMMEGEQANDSGWGERSGGDPA
jgi:hypothetical protein